MSFTASTGTTKNDLLVETVQPANEYDDAEENYQPKTIKFWTIVISVYLSMFVVGLDRTIIATAIPSITNDFNSVQDIGWYGSAYMLTAACFMPVSGRVYQLYSTKWIFALSIIIFEVGSTLCGAAHNSVGFIIGRAIAGLGSAGIFSGSTMVIIPLVPLRKRPVFTSFFGIAFGLSSVLGPMIGGAFTDHVSWRWCFLINLPIGGLTLLAAIFFLNGGSPTNEKLSITAQLKRLDPIGVLFFIPSMVCLILALQWGGSSDSWSAPKIIGLLVTFAVLFVGFVFIEVVTPDTAMAPTRVVLNRSVTGSMIFVLFLSGALMSVIYFLTIWFQVAKGDSAMRAGINIIPLVLSMTIVGIGAAVFTQKIGYYVPAMLLSPVLSSIGTGLLSTLSPSSGRNAWIGYQVLYGFGIGCGFQTATLAVQTVLPRADVPLGLALMFFLQQIGGSIFLAVSQNIFSTKLVDRLSGVAGLNTTGILSAGATDLRDIVSPDQMQTIVNAYSYALTRVFILAAALSAGMILGAATAQWRKIEGKKGSKGPSSSPGSDTEDIETKQEAKK